MLSPRRLGHQPHAAASGRHRTELLPAAVDSGPTCRPPSRNAMAPVQS